MSTTMMMKTIGMTGPVLEVKAAADGVGEAKVAFAQLNVVDHDRDYTVPGAFQVGQQLKVCQTGHAHGALPIGAGEITGEVEIDGALWAVADLKLFTDTTAGKDTHTVLKRLAELGHTQEWSYGYDILESAPGEVGGQSVQILKRLSVYEVSPVLRGAGIGTHTIGVKSKDGACEACGQTLPKAADDDAQAKAEDEVETCADCGKDEAECGCADAKGRATDLAVAFMAMKARRMNVPFAD